MGLKRPMARAIEAERWFPLLPEMDPDVDRS